MNLGTISTPNTKGQIVIPKKIRDKLGITPNTPLNIVHHNQGIFIHPIENVSLPNQQTKSQILTDILKQSKGAWAKQNWQQIDQNSQKRQKIELKSSQENQKQTW